ncbi:MAG TPA: helix-turn-helix transcriptional regulator [Actinocrinis sp.]|uniref:helix-turn-helix domain-containing protein n=1 Tax=Actinocrinis sp. TaxID=1920516 RepID=UPI002DDD93E7|nr:helix-turn-helix transcriptional regulator [Actinocrinis sp.]HEV3174222.1 helix-turn-helix transcriptional regulator [Actinocrinis sp.]
MVANTDPVVFGHRLRTRLRRAREEADLTQEQVGRQLEWSAKKLNRIETGATPVSPGDVTKLAALYALGPEETQNLLDEAARAGRAPWWHRYRDLVGPDFGHFLSYERSATEIRGFQPNIIHGLIQTEEYAREILASVGVHELRRRVALRLERRVLFEHEDSPRTEIILGQAALHNQVGGAAVHDGQLRRVLELAAQDQRIRLGIVPFAASTYPAMLIGFDLIELPDGQTSLYLEFPHVSRTTKDETILNDEYGEYYAQIRGRALFGADAVALVDAVLDARSRGDCV